MRMTSVTGHMMELEFAPAYKNWTSCNPRELFTAPVIKDVKKENEQIKRTLLEANYIDELNYVSELRNILICETALVL